MSYDPCTEFRLNLTRRHFLQHGTTAGIGAAALSSLLDLPRLHAATMAENNGPGYEPGTPGPVHFPARAKRVIYLFQSGAPSQIDTFDYKPTLEKLNGQNLPDSIRGKQRLTGMTVGQKSFPAAKSFTKFHQHGQSGQWISDLLPFHHQIADDICIIKSMHTEAINHDPAITFFQTGHQQPGRPSLGAWASYGLGSTNANLPAFVVLLDKNSDNQAQPTYSRLWGSGFLPSRFQGTRFRSGQDPVLYLSNPQGLSAEARRQMLDRLKDLPYTSLCAEPRSSNPVSQKRKKNKKSILAATAAAKKQKKSDARKKRSRNTKTY